MAARGGANRDPDRKRDQHDDRKREEAADAMRRRLPGRIERRVGMRRVDPRIGPRARGVVDAGAGQADRPRDAAMAQGYMGAAHAEGQARSRLREIDRQPGKDIDPAIESEVAHDGLRNDRRRATAKTNPAAPMYRAASRFRMAAYRPPAVR